MPENNSPSEVTLDTLLQTGTGADNPNKPNNDTPLDNNAGIDDNKGKEPGAKPNVNNSNDFNNNDHPSVKVRDYFKSLNDLDDSDEENKQVRDKLFAKYKGASFNAQGDLLDENREVVKTFDELYEDIANEDNEEVVDKDGNLIDADGNIIKTKAEIDAEKSIVNKFNQTLGYEFKDDKGQIKTYADSEEGLQEFAFDIANYKFQQFQEEFVNQNRDLIELNKHVLAGGDITTFNKEENYADIDIKKLSTTSKIDYIRKSFKQKGFSDERIEANISRIEAGGDVDKELVFALEDLENHQESVKAERTAKAEQAIAAQQKELEDYWNEIENTIKGGQLNNITLNKEDQTAFFNYLTKPVKGGKTQSQLDREKSGVKEDLTLEFLKFKGFKLDSLVSSKARSMQAEGLKDLIARSAKLNDGSFNSKKNNNKASAPKILSIDDLL